MLESLAWTSIVIAILCSLWIAIDEARHPQKMAIMNVVWPVSALYFSIFAVWAYYRIGRGKSKDAPAQPASRENEAPTMKQVAVGTSHCGAGCMLADIVAEFGIAAAGITLFGLVLWAEFAIDFCVAWALGIVFQYFALKPMRNLSPGRTILAAIKADTLSILAFQVGMYAWMALVFFKLYTHPHLTPFDPGYWLMMQIGMICGYATSFPMNYVLIRIGLKEAM